VCVPLCLLCRRCCCSCEATGPWASLHWRGWARCGGWPSPAAAGTTSPAATPSGCYSSPHMPKGPCACCASSTRTRTCCSSHCRLLLWLGTLWQHQGLDSRASAAGARLLPSQMQHRPSMVAQQRCHSSRASAGPVAPAACRVQQRQLLPAASRAALQSAAQLQPQQELA
jgi:hypothetical protein